MNIMDPRKLAVCYGDLCKKWVSKSFRRYFNARNRRSRRGNFRNELSGVPEEIINALYSFDCDSDEDFVGFA
jgi:hypothetical protein